MQQGLQAQNRAQRQGDFKDNSTIETNFGELCCFVLHQYTYLSVKESSFFWFVVMRSTEPGTRMLQIVFFAVFGKLSMRRGAWAWFDDVWNCGPKVLEYWMISSLKIKFYCSWKFQRNWNVPLVLLERSWWAQFHGIYLVRFGFRLWEILIFKWFMLLKIQINPQKTRFWKEKIVEDVVTLGSMAQATLV